MRIWIINHYALPPTMAGGTRHYNFARSLIKRGHDTIIIAANYNHFSQNFIETTAKVGEIDYTFEVPFMWIPTPAYRGNSIARFLNMLVFSVKILTSKYLSSQSPPDIIIGSSPHLFAAFSAALLAKRLKIPFILEVRDLWPESLIELGRLSSHHPLIKLMKKIELYLYKKSDKIISLLPAVNKYLIEQGVKDKNIIWLPNAIDAKNIPNNLPNIKSDKFTIMYAGAHGLANDLDTVLYAAKILQFKYDAQHIRIILLGDGPEKNRLKQLAVKLNLSIVDFQDSVSKTKIYSVLNTADAFLMLLKNSPVFRWGISPNKLFDYLVMGSPIIFGVNTPFNPIEKVKAGISIQPENAELLALAMYELSKLPKNQLIEMGARGKKFVLDHHDIQKLTDRLVELLIDTMTQFHARFK